MQKVCLGSSSSSIRFRSPRRLDTPPCGLLNCDLSLSDILAGLCDAGPVAEGHKWDLLVLAPGNKICNLSM